MIVALLRKFFGSRNDRILRSHRRTVAKINDLEAATRALSDEQLAGLSDVFRQRLKDGSTLEQLLPEAFAAVREAARRTVGMRHFDVQLIGGIVLHQGNIAEMATGEGKTLVATLPLYLNALSGQGVHLITVNDYLAERDSKWMQPIYQLLGLSVGCVVAMQDHQTRRGAYQADITYGTNNEFGFDYLRDNMAFALEDRVQRPLHYAIVDEVDSILIDEARTPLIISGQAADSVDLYRQIDRLVIQLKPVRGDQAGDYTLDEKQRQVELTEAGHEKAEGWLLSEGLLQQNESLYSADTLRLLHHVQSALRAHLLYKRDSEYIVQDGAIVLIDEHTGRTMANRRLAEGLHQALEAKEGLAIQSESQTLASTTFQNFFRIYEKLAGMTGTADTEAREFHQIYGLEVTVIPPNQTVIRQDLNDLIYLDSKGRFLSVAKDIEEYVKKGAPVLVGTTSVENSEKLSYMLTNRGIKHAVLNAKHHQQEAQIIAQAGQSGAVTVATNMAGRGTDIVLGGNVEAEIAAAGELEPGQQQKMREQWQQRHRQVIDAGGLHVLGTERHESRRIDNQLRGRAGRQGDPGMSRFYLSMDDNLMRIFLSDRVKKFMQTLGLKSGEAIEHRMVTNAIEKAQFRVEARNFEIRKQLLEYDDIANTQRKVVYSQRTEILASDNISDSIAGMREDAVREQVQLCIEPGSMPEQWRLEALVSDLKISFDLSPDLPGWLEREPNLSTGELADRIVLDADSAYRHKSEQLGAEMHHFEKIIMLEVIDTLWKKHLSMMEHLRQGIHLRAYAQRNPKQEFKREAFEMFQGMLQQIRFDVTRVLAHFRIEESASMSATEQRRREEEKQRFQQRNAAAGTGDGVRKKGNRRQRRLNQRKRKVRSMMAAAGGK